MTPPALDPSRPLGRSWYVVAGFLLFCLKFNVDRFAALAFGRRDWSPDDYLKPFSFWYGTAVTDPGFGWLLLATAVPFAALGVLLTVRRLRSAGASPVWALLFFAPYLNLFLFALLAVLPEKRSPEQREGPADPPDVAGYLPSGRLGSALVSATAAALLAAAVVYVSADVFGQYGVVLFAGVPFAAGFGAVALAARRSRTGPWASAALGASAVALAGAAVICLLLEGMICVAMAAPLAFPLGAFGGWTAWALFRYAPAGDARSAAAFFVPAVMPLLGPIEDPNSRALPLIEVATTVTVDAPPAAVWPHVVRFPDLPAPEGLLFKTGIAYPVRARLEGHGVGAVRYCEFSTGPFVEPITAWEEPRRLAFDVTARPRPMEEWSPFGRVDPPHLDGFFLSERGEFLLTGTPDGRTVLRGTTWYRHAIRPAWYWSWISDRIVHAIHGRVLSHVKAQAEAGGVGRPS